MMKIFSTLPCVGTTGRALDLRLTGHVLKFYSGQKLRNNLGQVASVTKQYNLVPAKRQWCSAAGKVTAGLAKSNVSVPPGGWLIVTSRLTASPGSAPGPKLGNEYEKPVLPCVDHWVVRMSGMYNPFSDQMLFKATKHDCGFNVSFVLWYVLVYWCILALVMIVLPSWLAGKNVSEMSYLCVDMIKTITQSVTL